MYRYRQRERRVWEKSSGASEGAHMIITVRSGGSSTVLSSALAPLLLSRSALLKITTRHGATVGRLAARPMTSRTVSTGMMTSCGSTKTRSVCCLVPSTARQASHFPQPGSSGSVHMSAAAKSIAAKDRPEPGGPVKSQEWLIARGSAPGIPRAARAAPKIVRATPGVSANRCATLPVFTRSSLLVLLQ